MPKTSVKKYATWSNGASSPASVRPTHAALVVRVRPVLDQVPATGDRVVEAREVADREDARDRPCAGVRRPATAPRSRASPSSARYRRCRLDADADDREVGLDATSTEGRRVARGDRRRAVPSSRRRARPRRRGPGRAARARSTARDGRVPRRAARQARSPSRQDRGVRNEAAVSIPMKPAPTMSARPAVRAASRTPSASSRVR